MIWADCLRTKPGKSIPLLFKEFSGAAILASVLVESKSRAREPPVPFATRTRAPRSLKSDPSRPLILVCWLDGEIDTPRRPRPGAGCALTVWLLTDEGWPSSFVAAGAFLFGSFLGVLGLPASFATLLIG